jgi:hypothetical protein
MLLYESGIKTMKHALNQSKSGLPSLAKEGQGWFAPVLQTTPKTAVLISEILY